MSTSQYPQALDELANPTSQSQQDDPGVEHSGLHARANDAIEAVQAVLGLNPQGNAATVDARIEVVEQALADGGGGGGGAGGGIDSLTYANAVPGTLFVIYRDPTSGAWPAARPSNRTDLTFGWCGVDPSPTIVSSGTGGMLAEVDIRMLR